jgi:hypothetical protein
MVTKEKLMIRLTIMAKIQKVVRMMIKMEKKIQRIMKKMMMKSLIRNIVMLQKCKGTAEKFSVSIPVAAAYNLFVFVITYTNFE